MGKKETTTYVPGKNRHKRKHYWWRYLLVFALGQFLVIPEFIFAIGTITTAMDMETIMNFIPNVEPDDYLTEKSKKMTILDLAMYLSSPSFKPTCLDDLNDIVKLNGIIDGMASKNDTGKYINAIITEDFMKTDFKELGNYFTQKLELAPTLKAMDISLPGIVSSLLYDTPVAYFGKSTTNTVKITKGDNLDLAANAFTVLPEVASDSTFYVSEFGEHIEGSPIVNFKENSSKISVPKDSTLGTVHAIAALNKMPETISEYVEPIEFNIEVVDRMQLEKPSKFKFDQKKQRILWNKVDFANEYNITYPDSSTETIKQNFVDVSKISGLIDGATYTIKVKAIGDGASHLDSEVLDITFQYAVDPENSNLEKHQKTKSLILNEEEPVIEHNDVHDDVNKENHPNGYYDDTHELITKGLTINELGDIFKTFDIAKLLGNKTIGDLINNDESIDMTKEPESPTIIEFKETTDINEVLEDIQISSLLNGDFDLMSILGPYKLSIILKGKEDDKILGNLVDLTFDELTNDPDLMEKVLGGKKIKDLLTLEDDGLIGIISECCLIKPKDYPIGSSQYPNAVYYNGKFYENDEHLVEIPYEGPVDVIDKFNDLTIGEALGNADGNSGNAIMDCLANIKLSSNTIGDEMSEALKTKTVGELLNLDANETNNAILKSLINCKLSSESLEAALNDLKVITVIGEENMLDDPENPTKVIGIWGIMFDGDNAVEDAKNAKVTDMETLMGDMTDKIMGKTLFELQEVEIIADTTNLSSSIPVGPGETKQLGDLTIQGLIDAVNYMSSLLSI